jgi:hypothetical protein
VVARNAASSLIGRDDHRDALCTLRSRWRSASLASGWPFPSDWALAEVDEVCAAVVTGADLIEVVPALGRARASAGAGLDETLLDLAALHAVLTSKEALVSADPDATPSNLLRATALGWADAAADQLGTREAVDAMTGMTTTCYLRTRIGEVYRDAAADDHVLLLVGLDLSVAEGWTRSVAMVLVAQVLREVFPGGETVSLIGPSVAGVLARRDGRVATRLARVRWLLARRLSVDPHLREVGTPSVWPEMLPECHLEACELLAHLGG